MVQPCFHYTEHDGSNNINGHLLWYLSADIYLRIPGLRKHYHYTFLIDVFHFQILPHKNDNNQTPQWEANAEQYHDCV